MLHFILRLLFIVLCVGSFFAPYKSWAQSDTNFLGIQIQGLDKTFAEALNSPDTLGVIVLDIALPGPSQDGKLLRGDIIRQINGISITSVEQLTNELSKMPKESQLTLKLWRKGQEREISLTLGTMPKFWSATKTDFASEPSLGLTFVALTDKVRERFGIGWARRGVVVSLLDDDKSKKVDLRVGDVIEQVGQNMVWKPAHILSYLRTARKEQKKFIPLLVNGFDGYRYVLMPVL